MSSTPEPTTVASHHLAPTTNGLEALFAMSGARGLELLRHHRAPDALEYTAHLEVPGGRGFVLVDAGGPHESLELTLINLAQAVAAFVAHRDGP